jgi:GNAT superfamily N-acetyltransferase
MYVGGTDPIDTGETVARWTATYEPPMSGDPGHVWIGDGRIDLEIESLRGIGIGSLLMLPLVRWAKERPCNVTVVPISLAGPDADTEEKRCRRNRFYEKLGFKFNYADDEKTYGEALEMPVSELITPDFKMSRGWRVASLSATGKVF